MTLCSWGKVQLDSALGVTSLASSVSWHCSPHVVLRVLPGQEDWQEVLSHSRTTEVHVSSMAVSQCHPHRWEAAHCPQGCHLHLSVRNPTFTTASGPPPPLLHPGRENILLSKGSRDEDVPTRQSLCSEVNWFGSLITSVNSLHSGI